MIIGENASGADNQQERLQQIPTDGVCYFEVRAINDLNTSVRAFFRDFPLLSDRQSLRCKLLLEAVGLMNAKQHLSPEGLEKLLRIREKLISNRTRKYSITDVLQ